MKQWDGWKLPFFDESHDDLVARLQQWQRDFEPHEAEYHALDLQAHCRRLLVDLGERGFLAYAVPEQTGGAPKVDLRAICLIREALSYRSALADFVFSMQGIGTAALWNHGGAVQWKTLLDESRSGRRIAAFAITEPDGGSDVAATRTTARADGNDYVIDGRKAWISNGGIADHYLVIARTDEGHGARGLSAFVVDAEAPGLSCSANVDIMAPHPLAEIVFDGCRVPASAMLGQPGDGFKVAMSTLDIFRSSVGAAAVGLARRAIDETLMRVSTRVLFGQTLAEMDSVRMKIADMVVELEAAAMIVYRAGWQRDTTGKPITREASMAKLFGTEVAQRVIDAALQLHGASGLVSGHILERLYRDVRPMRIYEGANEIQRIIIGRQVLADPEGKKR
ncbi:acyl-CoA dehydrogenase family protein [soil metagenome]